MSQYHTLVENVEDASALFGRLCALCMTRGHLACSRSEPARHTRRQMRYLTQCETRKIPIKTSLLLH